jgi:SAM-dependent methyltransferase
MGNEQEETIGAFWQANPCGENLVDRDVDWADWFRRYDAFRYDTEGHILGELDSLGLAGKKVLEIGIGQCADSAQIARRGALWYGLDLTEAALERARRRFELEGLELGDVRQGSVLEIPYADNQFDLIYSHGVLHHVPEIRSANEELLRVLKPGGRLVIMMYHKNSVNFRLSICIFRRIMMIALYGFGCAGGRRMLRSDVFLGHLENARREGLFRYLKTKRFTSANTDGPGNPFSKVYDEEDIAEDFSGFRLRSSRVHFLNRRHLPGIGFLGRGFERWLERNWGWHLWAELEPDDGAGRDDRL